MKKYAYVGALGLLSIITTEFGVIGVLPQIASHYRISIDQASWLLSGFALVIAFLGPLMTVLTVRMDKKKVMLLALALFVISSFISVSLPPFWLLFTLRLISALLQPVYIANALSIAVRFSPEDKHSQMMSIVFSGITIASFTTIPLATYLTNGYGLEAIFLIQGIVSSIAFMAIYIFLPCVPGDTKVFNTKELVVFRDLSFIRSALVNLFILAMWFSVYSYFADYLSKEKNMSGLMVGNMVLLFGLIGVVAMYIGGKVLSKGVVYSNVFYIMGAALIALLLYISGSESILTVLIVSMWSLFYTPVYLNATAFLQKTTKLPFELGSSLSTSLGNLGIAVGTFVGGKVIAYYGLQFLPLAMLIFALLSLVLIYFVVKFNKVN
ncbi:MFS transporter [Myroides sp. LoEW2-1]|uniref:MFS transporter n=1 Tax=Myroides sp. LoEW2-1 TaxID=2683192 RepID=UPI00132A8BB5|nr:MFS transporter [Myroides sp. LoEW2-1]MVX34497.1 MFS transporter [Myroides sp. LoEW2-1]